MKLHRLVLANYRGIAHREIVFPDSGVVIVSGANEIGKSSMIEALDLLLETKDRSSKKEVKLVKPTHADAGAEVTAEISTGPYHFVYHKRFHKKCRTQLTVLTPRREQLTGDEAHERVDAMLAETIDTDLWRAQRVLQASSTAAVDLAGCDALSRALDLAAGSSESHACDGPLIDRVDAEYGRYFTPTGRPTGEWGAVGSRLRAAEQEVGRCSVAVTEVDDAVRRHAEVTRRLDATADARKAAAQRSEAAGAAVDALAEVVAELTRAELAHTAAQAEHAAAAAESVRRTQLVEDLSERQQTAIGLAAALAEATSAESAARAAGDLAQQAADSSQAVARMAQLRVEQARRVLDRVTAGAQARRLASRLAKIDVGQRELDGTNQDLAAVRLTAADLRAIEVAEAAVDRAAAQVELASVSIELSAAAGVELRVGGEHVVLPAGGRWAVTSSAATDVELPGLVTARIVPGTAALDSRKLLDAARSHLTALLEDAGVPDVAAARAADEHRRELIATRDRCAATLAGLCGGETVGQIRARLADLQQTGPRHAERDLDVPAARAELDAASAASEQARARGDTDQQAVAAATAELAQRGTDATVLREKLAAAHAERDATARRLSEQRERCGDAEVARRADAAGDRASRAGLRVERLRAQVEQRGADAAAAELADARRDAARLDREHDELSGEVRDLTTALRVFGTEGRKGRLDAAEAEREHAEGEYNRIRRRARAVELLRDVMVRHRDGVRLRYVEPFRGELERLGRLVFGDSFEVDVDSDLRIVSRTMAGRTVPYESLSGGAKEQLGIVARLAAAALVAPQDTVPVIVDDALGFSDADRLARMGPVFGAVGSAGQVIVLTCNPHRFDAVADAHRIDLSRTA